VFLDQVFSNVGERGDPVDQASAPELMYDIFFFTTIVCCLAE